MTIQISRDLFLSLLATDAYNRGYNAGLSDGGVNDTDGLGDATDGSARIGSGTITANIETVGIKDESEAVGFYALAYDIGTDGPEGLANTTVISYRGTEAPGGLSENGDILTGALAGHALDFYNQTAPNHGENGPDSNLVLTGHSLANGLAGLASVPFVPRNLSC